MASYFEYNVDVVPVFSLENLPVDLKKQLKKVKIPKYAVFTLNKGTGELQFSTEESRRDYGNVSDFGYECVKVSRVGHVLYGNVSDFGYQINIEFKKFK